MAGRTVPRRSVASEVATILDSPEVSALVAELDALRWTGRRGYGARTMLGACIVKALYALPTWTRTADLIAEHPGLAATLGGTPSHWACYRFARKLRGERAMIAECVDALAASLRVQHPNMGREYVEVVAVVERVARHRAIFADPGVSPPLPRFANPS